MTALAPNTYYAKVAGGGLGHVRLGVSMDVGSRMLAHALVVMVFLPTGNGGSDACAVRLRPSRLRGRTGAAVLTCVVLFVWYIVYMASAGGDLPSAFRMLASVHPRDAGLGAPGDDRSHQCAA